MSSILKRHKKLDKIYHAESKLVFKSIHDKVVTGKIVDGEYLELNQDIINECKLHKFKYDESMIGENDHDIHDHNLDFIDQDKSINIPIVLVGFGYEEERLSNPRRLNSVKLELDCKNEFDSNAIKAICTETGKYVYVSKDTNEKLHSYSQFFNTDKCIVTLIEKHAKSIKANVNIIF